MKRLVLAAMAAAAALTVGFLPIPAGAQNNVITIGFTASNTGALNVDSTAQLNGFELWKDQVNARGGIKVGTTTYKVKLIYYDDQSKGDRVQQLYTRLILQDGAQFLFSPYSSGLTATAAIISEQYGKIMLTTGAAEDKTYELGNRYLFQMYTPASHYLTSAMDALKEKNPKTRLAFVYADDPFSKAVVASASAYAKKIGLNVVFNEAYAPDTTDFSPIINKVIGSRADALAGGGHYADGATLARQLYNQKANLDFISILVAPDSPKFSELGEAAVGITVPSQWEPQVTFKPQFGPDAATFVRDYRARFHGMPGYHAAGGYATGLMLQNALERAGSLDTAQVVRALNATDLTLFYGKVKFATSAKEHGLQVGHSMVLAQWQKGRRGKLEKQVVYPTAAQTANLLFPIRK